MKKRSFKTLAVLMAIFLVGSLLTACGEKNRIIKSEGMSMALSKEYKKSSLANATWYYESPDCLAMGIKSSKDDIEKSGLETGSVQDYAEAYIKANNIPGNPKIKSRGDYYYFTYKRKVSGTDYSYLTCVYDNNDYIWLINFACYKELFNENKSVFFESADSVEFAE